MKLYESSAEPAALPVSIRPRPRHKVVARGGGLGARGLCNGSMSNGCSHWTLTRRQWPSLLPSNEGLDQINYVMCAGVGEGVWIHFQCVGDLGLWSMWTGNCMRDQQPTQGREGEGEWPAEKHQWWTMGKYSVPRKAK